MDVVHTNGTIKTYDEYSVELSSRIRANPNSAYNTLSFYVNHLKRWVELFERQQILILSYNEFVIDPSKTALRLEDFLGSTMHGGFEKVNGRSNACQRGSGGAVSGKESGVI